MTVFSRLMFALLLPTLGACDGANPPATAPAAAAQPVAATSAAVVDPDSAPPRASGADTGGVSQAAAATATPVQLPPSMQFTRPWFGDLDGMEERRVLRVLTVYGAGRYYLDGAEEKGLVAEMMNEFEDELNQQLKRDHLRVHVVIMPVARDQLIPALLAGRGDLIAAGLSITPGREEDVAFSIPSTKPLSEILVTGPAAPPVASIDDLAGQTIPVRESSSYRESLELLNRRFAKEGKAPVVIEPMSELLEDDDLIEMVNAGLLPWAIVDDYKTTLWDGVFKNLTVRDDIVFRDGGQIGWAFRKNSPLLEQAINGFLKGHREGTLLGNILRNRYIRDFDWAANALDKTEYQRFEELETIFRRYGEQYDIEYLLAAAQGFQESRLDQSRRSAAGAIGVMQLLPATATDSHVSISNIDNVDNNIHAGIKYMDFLRDRYFSDPAIDPLNQALLSLAAYNAGPSRMINLRSKAEAAGYDPNRWFDNVELIAARDIGRETVQYVANIYKYYISYRLAAAQQTRRQAAREAAGITD